MPRRKSTKAVAPEHAEEVTVKSLGRMGQLLGVSLSTLEKLRAAGRIPATNAIVATAAALLAMQADDTEKRERDKQQWELAMEVKRLDLDERRHDLNKRLGQVMPRAEHDSVSRNAALTFRAVLEQIPAELAGKDEATMTDWIRAKLEEMAA